MSYPLPIAELVTQDVEATLRGVVTTLGSNGKPFIVERFKKGGENGQEDLTAIIGFGDDEPLGDDDTPINFKAWQRPYWVVVYLYEDSESGTPYDQRVDVVRADICKALMADVTRGGFAQNTEIGLPIRFDDVNDATGILINFDVRYWHREEDPYSMTE